MPIYLIFQLLYKVVQNEYHLCPQDHESLRKTFQFLIGLFYNHGDMKRDFTYIDDLIEGIIQLIDEVPLSDSEAQENLIKNDSKSAVAPYRVVNIGNSKPEKLTDFIALIENSLGIIAKKNYLPMQSGDVSVTWANSDLIKNITGFQPETDIFTGVSKFVGWYREYYNE